MEETHQDPGEESEAERWQDRQKACAGRDAGAEGRQRVSKVRWSSSVGFQRRREDERAETPKREGGSCVGIETRAGGRLQWAEEREPRKGRTEEGESLKTFACRRGREAGSNWKMKGNVGSGEILLSLLLCWETRAYL